MEKNIFSKVGEGTVTAFRHAVARVFPQLCIGKTLKSNPDAWDFMPSLKAQAKAIAKMPIEELAKRFWSAETLKVIFHEKHLYWFPMTDMEFYNLLTDKKSVRKAISHPQANFTDKQIRTLIANRGLYELANVKMKGLSEFVAREVTGNTKYSEELLPMIMNMPEFSQVYNLWLERHEPSSIPEDAIINAIRHLFVSKVEVSVDYDEKLLEVATTWRHKGIDNHALWLSFALHNLDKEQVFTSVVKHFNTILAYVEEYVQYGWKEQFLKAVMKSPHCSFDLTEQIYELFTRNSDKQEALGCMVGRVSQLYQICTCFNLLEGTLRETRDCHHKYLISRALNILEKVYNRAVARTTAGSYLKKFLEYEGWTEAQREKALRAMAAGQSLTEEDFANLSDEDKNIVINEWEIFSQFALIEQDPEQVIEKKINLLPEVEVRFFTNVDCRQFWRKYVEMYQVSELAYSNMIDKGQVGLLNLHVSTYGLTDWQYRQLMNSSLKRLAPQLKSRLKK